MNPPIPTADAGHYPDPGFVQTLEEETGLSFITDGRGDIEKDFGPEDVLAYIYAIFHWPEYRRRFEPMLKLDCPRVPTPTPGSRITGKSRKKSAPADFFKRMVPLGHKLLAAHLLEDDTLDGSTVSYPASGDNVVAKGYPTYVPPHKNEDAAKTIKKAKDKLAAHPKLGRVFISPDQYFEGVEPAVWDFQIGGYQVCDKWLKDRRSRALSYDDLSHYRRVVESLRETIALMAEVESAASG